METTSTTSIQIPDDFDYFHSYDSQGNEVIRLRLSKIKVHEDRIRKLYEFFIKLSVIGLDYSKKNMVVYEVCDPEDILNKKPMIFIIDILTPRVFGYGIYKVLEIMKNESNTLLCLNFSFNGFTNKEAIFMAETLMYNKTLKVLKLKGNKIKDPGLLALSEMLKVNRHLEELDLKNNSFTSYAVGMLSKSLRNANSLAALDIRALDCELNRIKPISKLAYLNPKLKSFQVI